MKFALIALLTLTSFSALATDVTCICGSLAGCPERLTVTVKSNNKGELIGEISHFGVVKRSKVQYEQSSRTLDLYAANNTDPSKQKGWILSREYNINGTTSGRLQIFEEKLSNELEDAPTHNLRCFDN